MASHYFNKKVYMDGYGFASEKERDFYAKFIKPSGMRFELQPNFKIMDRCMIGGTDFRGHGYKPDFVIKRPDGSLAHVYDVKAGFTSYSVSTPARLRFAAFARRYHVPVECVVVRKHDFKMKIFDLSNPKIQAAHVRKDLHGKIKKSSKTGKPLYDYYDVFRSLDYDIADIIGC